MAKMYKRSMSVFLILAMLLGLVPLPSAVPRAAAASNDPFATMYNSDALFMEKVTPLLEGQNRRVEMEALRDGAPEIDQRSFRALEAGGFESREQKVELTAESVLEMTKRGELSTAVDSMDFVEAERIEQLYEDARLDRFIVKYKSESNLSVLTASRTRGTSEEISGGVELVILNERVNPKEFADSLHAANMEREIEYIQPDFTLEFAALELSYEEVEPEEEEIEEPILDEDEEPLLEELEEEVEESESNEILVALIDTGVDIYHEALQGVMVDGWNFVDDTGDVFDPASPISASHGTHIAGIIAETGGENVKILPLQVFGSHGAYTSDIIAAIVYAEAQGAQVVNMSFGSTSYNPALYETIENSDMLFVASVGNARSDLAECPIYPAAFGLPNIISVASTNADGGFSYYSNYSAEIIDIAAQGRDVYSALPGNEYGLQSGTSMSAGYVTGVAGAVLSAEDMTADDLKNRILTSADMLSSLQNKVVDGRRVNLTNALLGVPGDYLHLNPEDDFDVHGYQRTEGENWQLFSSLTMVQVNAGTYHSLALAGDGTVWAWGCNDYGQLGDGTTTARGTPTQVVGLTGVVSIAAGNYHSLAVKSDGTVWAWGMNGSGQLGDGSTTDRWTPVQVNGLTGAESISAGGAHSLAVKPNGTAWAWGGNWSGQLGDGSTTQRLTPVQVNGLTGVVSIAAGQDHSLAVKYDGTAWAWGYNWNGQLGIGTSGNNTNSNSPVQINVLSNVLSAAAGGNRSLAVKNDGTVWTWGSGSPTQISSTPMQISGLADVVSADTGGNHILALKQDNTVWAWGYNGYGQLGDGNTTDSNIPVQVSDLANVSDISAGGYHSMALKATGSVWAWGSNQQTQIGDGSIWFLSTPSQLTSMTDIIAISAGNYHSLAVKNDGTVWAWGSGPLGDGTYNSYCSPIQVQGLSDIVSITAGYYRSYAIESDGTVWVWGSGPVGDGTYNSYYSPTQVQGLSNIVSIVDGGNYNYSVALASDGTVWAWGYCWPLADGLAPEQIDGLSDVKEIVLTGCPGIMALKTDGTVWVCGYDEMGSFGLGALGYAVEIPTQIPGLSDIEMITADMGNGFAVDSGGTVWGWGIGSNGWFGDEYNYIVEELIQLSDFPEVAAILPGILIATDGKVWRWGEYYDYSGNWVVYGEPTEMPGLSDVWAMSMGDSHCLYLNTSGEIFVCGNGSNGQLGLGGARQYLTPVRVANYGSEMLRFEQDFYTMTISSSTTANETVTAKYIDSDGNAVPNAAIVYSLAAPYTGVSVNPSTGVVTAGPTARTGTVTVKAEYNNLEATAAVILVKEPVEISFDHDTYEVEIPDFDSEETNITATAYDEDGGKVSGAAVEYSLAGSYSGVSVNVTTGAVTVDYTTQPGTVTLEAVSGSFDADTELVFIKKVHEMSFKQDVYNLDIPIFTAETAVRAALYDIAGLEIPSNTIEYSLDGSYPGVNLNTSTGAIIVDSTAQPGTVKVNAAYKNFTATADLILTINENWYPFTSLDVVQMSAGWTYNIALARNGTVWTWGNNESGQLGDGTSIARGIPKQIIGLTDVAMVSAGQAHSLAVKSNGTVWAWGNNSAGQLGDGTTTSRGAPVQVNGLTDVISAAAGGSRSLALKSDGTVWAWGNNSAGQLGDGTTTSRGAPVQVNGLTDIVSISAGYMHSLAVKNDGTVWAWGYNSFGQLGDGTTTNRTSPVQVNGLSDVVSVSAGYNHSLAVKSDGTVWAWGYNYNGQLGDGTTSNRSAPVQVMGLSGMSSVSAGMSHSLGHKSDNTVWSWGDNTYGQLGDGSQTNNLSPAQVSGLTNISAVSAGSGHSVALKLNGSLLSWGNNSEGQIGDGSAKFWISPVQLASMADVVDLSAGGSHSLAVKSDGTVWAWGANWSGQLGDGSTADSHSPVQVQGLSGVVAVSAGASHSLALKSNGTVWAWGANDYRQLGNDNSNEENLPVQILGLSDIVEIAAGDYQGIALKSDGTVWAWGMWCELGGILLPEQVSGLTNIKAIAVGFSEGSGMALKTDGTVWAWGYTPTPIPGLSDIEMIAMANENGFAVENDDTVWGWGSGWSGLLGEKNYYGYVEEPIELSGFPEGISAIIPGYTVDKYGAVWEWGGYYDAFNTKFTIYGPSEIPGLTDIVAVASAGGHGLFLKSNGDVWVYGDDSHGQLGLGRVQGYLEPIKTMTFGVEKLSFEQASYEIIVHNSTTSGGTVCAKHFNMDGSEAVNAVALYSLGTPYPGVSIDAATGAVTVAYTAAPGTVTITAVFDEFEATAELILIQPELFFDQDTYEINIPDADTLTVIVRATVYNQYGQHIPNAVIAYALDTPYSGVNIDNATGAVSVDSSAEPGTAIISASYRGYSSSVELAIRAMNAQLTINTVSSRQYDITLTAGQIQDFSGIELILQYDSAVFDLVDLCSFTKEKELTTGQINTAGITITQVILGEIHLTIDRTIPSGKLWSGTINVIRLKAKASADSTMLFSKSRI